MTEATTNGSSNAAKAKHWSGSLVDVGCMAKALGAAESVTAPQAEPGAGVPHFAGGGPHAGQVPGGGAGGGMGPGQRGQEPTPGMPATGGADSDEQARSERASKLDNAAKTCAASSTTQNVGLAMSDGQVLQFDSGGAAKAQEAMKQAEVEPGKKVKAKVSGFMEDKNTVKVAAVDVKGKGKGKGKGR